MNTKKLLVSFLAIASLLLLVASVSAGDVAEEAVIKIDGIDAVSYDSSSTSLPQGLFFFDTVSVIAGETVPVKITFTAANDDTDVTFEAEFEGQKVKSSEISSVFDIEAGKQYTKTVLVEVPFELKDEISDDLVLNVVLDGRKHKTEIEDISVRVQRPSYNPSIKSVTIDQTVRAGETFPVDIVLKNTGYNDLDDLYVTVSIPSLGILKSSYFGDLANLDDCSEDCEREDTTSGRLYLTVPYGVASGTYDLKVEVSNDDTKLSASRQIIVTNDFSENVLVFVTGKTVDVGEDAVFNVLIVNPTDQVQVYSLVSDSGEGFSTSVSENLVAVSAGSSKNVEITANAESAGDYSFNVNVFKGEQLAKSVTFNLKAESDSSIDPIVVLTIVLAIVFVVLLIVLIVLIARKPAKSEEFGESYY